MGKGSFPDFDPSDELRQNGFSKDGKTAELQGVLGLLVSEDGYPLSYSIFNGKQYKGYTMIPIIDDFVRRFSLTDFIVVADAGLMSEANVRLLEEAGYKYVIVARIRKESGIPMSVDKVLSVAKTITTIRLRLPNGELYTETLYTTPQQKAIRSLIEPNCGRGASLSKSGIIFKLIITISLLVI